MEEGNIVSISNANSTSTKAGELPPSQSGLDGPNAKFKATTGNSKAPARSNPIPSEKGKERRSQKGSSYSEMAGETIGAVKASKREWVPKKKQPSGKGNPGKNTSRPQKSAESINDQIKNLNDQVEGYKIALKDKSSADDDAKEEAKLQKQKLAEIELCAAEAEAIKAQKMNISWGETFPQLTIGLGVWFGIDLNFFSVDWRVKNSSILVFALALCMVPLVWYRTSEMYIFGVESRTVLLAYTIILMGVVCYFYEDFLDQVGDRRYHYKIVPKDDQHIDLRPDVCATGKMNHANPRYADVHFVDKEKDEEVKFEISLELLTQIATPRNMSLAISPTLAAERLAHTSQTLHSVNYDRYKILGGTDIPGNTAVVGYALYQQRLQKMKHVPFPRPVQ
jgi:hypothetical protein